jgi:hypothetical protein
MKYHVCLKCFLKDGGWGMEDEGTCCNNQVSFSPLVTQLGWPFFVINKKGKGLWFPLGKAD